jgi:PAS domain S-box-containing protein
MEKTHPLLNQQLKDHFGDAFVVPAEWRGFIQSVNDAYTNGTNGSDRKSIGTDVRARNEVSTAHQHTQAALRKGESQFRTLAKLSPVGIFRADMNGRATYWNEKLCEMTGMTVEEALGEGWTQGIHPEDRPRVFEEWHKCVQERRPFKLQYRFVHKKGPVIWTIGEATAIVDGTDHIAGYVGTVSDTTELKTAELKLAEASGLLEAMLENSPDPIYFKDRESRFVRVSKSFLQRIGLSDSETLRGKTDADVYAAVHAASALADEQEILRTGKPIIGKLEMETHPDGRLTWVLTTKMCWRDGSGAIVGTFGISKDITARKEAEQKLAYERDQLRALLEAVPDAIYFKDRQSRFVLASRSKLQSTLDAVPDLRARRAARGLPVDVTDAELLVGLDDFDTFTEDDARIAYGDEQQILRTGEPLIGKLSRQVFLDGSAKWWLTSKMPWKDHAGSIIGTFGISKDLTALKQAEADLERAHKDLVEASRVAGMAEVAINVLHSVGNVLNSLNISTSVIAERTRESQIANIAKLSTLFQEHQGDLGAFLTTDPRGQRVPAFLAAVTQQLTLDQSATLAELEGLRKNVDLLAETIAQQQKFVTAARVIEAFPLVDLLEEVLRLEGVTSGGKFAIVQDYDARPTITIERHKVRQILASLVQNAKHACDESGKTIRTLNLRIAADQHHAWIKVTDNGVGISAEDLTRIFRHGASARQEGHGFGLHHAATTAFSIGGSLTAQSPGLGHGATFTLQLPLSPPAAAG